ncbi:MAG: hypothetical protein RLZZ618_2269 [Pseudomonadota bacterium]|jgi:hypothetical protein
MTSLLRRLLLSAPTLAGVTALATALLAGCATPPPADSPPQGPADDYLRRADAQVLQKENVSVKVAVLRPWESQAVFGVPLADKGIQPVFVNIDNRSKQPYWFMPVYMDRDFFSPREAAYAFTGSSGHEHGGDNPLERSLSQQQVRLHVPAGGQVRGFVYTAASAGIKLINVELVGSRSQLQFAFARELPGGGFDNQGLDPARLYGSQALPSLTHAQLRNTLRALPCCTTNAEGTVAGDPLNLAFVGTQHELLVALVRGGWDFTDTTNASSVGHMISSMLTGSAYRSAPVSKLYFNGRAQDFSMQRARASGISQRNHLRLWLAPYRVDGKPVWMGQISRDIGVRLTTRSPFLTTHKVDPDVDEAREYLRQDLLLSSSLGRWGLVAGVGEAPQSAPRENLTGDPYFTDGLRLVLFLSDTPRPIREVEVLEWDAAKAPASTPATR